MRKLLLLFFFLSEIALAKEPVLIGGRLAEPGDFPEVLYISSGRSRCSAVIVGPNVILTAAHCINDGGEISPVEFQLDQEVFKARCQHHPEYASKYSFDFAMCKTDRRMEVKYASIDDKPVEMDKMVTLMGYGCINPRDDDNNGGDGWDGRLRYGKAVVTQLPGDSVGGGQYFITNDNTALCFGDSGGPAMRELRAPQLENHFVVGINSRGDIRRRSLLSSTFLPGFRNWAKAYAIANEVAICGINKNCVENDPKPKPSCKRENRKVRHYTRKLQKWQERLEKCEMKDVYSSIFEPRRPIFW